MPTGVMKRWNEKGFGFIEPDDGGEDLFCHVSGLLDGEGSVRQGDEVKFSIDFDDRKGKDRAVKVELAGGGGGRRRDDRSRSRGRGGGRDRGGGRSRDRGGGKGSGGGGKGEKRPGDWECPDCRINNFASRDKCFKCGEPKPSGGGGGGRGRDDSRKRPPPRRRDDSRGR